MSAIEVVRRFVRRTYAGPMGIARRPPKSRLAPQHGPDILSQYRGQWVALVGDQVVAHAESSKQLASQLKALGTEGQEAVMQFVRPPVAGYVIGVG
jgi:hypothetical protein